MRLRSAALIFALTVAAAAFGRAQEPVADPEPTATPSPTPTPAPPSPPAPTPAPIPGQPMQGTSTIGQAFLFDYRSMVEKLQENPNNPALLNELGNFLLQHGRLQGAITQYNKALALQPNLAIVWNNLGVAYTAVGKFDDGERAYRKAIKLRPDYAVAYYNLGANYDQRNMYDPAIENYQRGLELDPGLLDVRLNPRIASNRHVPAILVKSYLDRGGSALLPVQSMYPTKQRRPAPPTK